MRLLYVVKKTNGQDGEDDLYTVLWDLVMEGAGKCLAMSLPFTVVIPQTPIALYIVIRGDCLASWNETPD